MARTYRRKRYTPAWVTEAPYDFIDPVTKVAVTWAGSIQLEGDARAKKLRWWHEDKAHWWGARPPKPYRMEVEMQHRAAARSELVRWLKDPDYEVMTLSKPKLDYWD